MVDIHELNTLPIHTRKPKAPESTELIYSDGRCSEIKFLNSLINKRVVIVGPAGYLQEQGKGDWIDTFDIVVRVNHAIPIKYPEDYGTKTDILYHILSHRGSSNKVLIEEEEIDLWAEQKVDWLVTSHSAISQRVKEIGPLIKNKLKWACVHHRFSNKIKQQISRKSPNTGILAIAHLLSSRLQSLTVVGFDLYQSGVYEGYGDLRENEDALEVNTRWHDIHAQMEFLRRLSYKEKYRLILDDVLKGILGV